MTKPLHPRRLQQGLPIAKKRNRKPRMTQNCHSKTRNPLPLRQQIKIRQQQP